MRKLSGAPSYDGPTPSPADLREDEALLQELRRRHPELYGGDTDETPSRSRRRKRTPIPAFEETAPARSPRPEPAGPPNGTLVDFLDGTFALTLMPAAACSPVERAMFFTELVPLRQALMDEYEIEQTSDGMLIDTAVVSFFEARILSSKAFALLSSGQVDKVRAGDMMDRAAHRAHSRFVTALELLRRGKSTPVKFEVEAVEQLHVGDQVIAVGSGGRGRR